MTCIFCGGYVGEVGMACVNCLAPIREKERLPIELLLSTAKKELILRQEGEEKQPNE